MLLTASQEVENQLAKNRPNELESHLNPITIAGSSMESIGENKSASERFPCAKSADEVNMVQTSAIPEKTQ